MNDLMIHFLMIFVVPTIENGVELCIRVCFGFFSLGVNEHCSEVFKSRYDFFTSSLITASGSNLFFRSLIFDFF